MHKEIVKLERQLAQVNEELEEVLKGDLSFDRRVMELVSLRRRIVSLMGKWSSTKAALLGGRLMLLHELVVKFESHLSLTADQIGVTLDPGDFVKG